MKLHLLIDSNIKPICAADDLAIVSSYCDVTGLNCKTVNLDLNIVNENIEIGEAIRKQLEDFDAFYFNVANEVYVRFFLPIYMVLANVEKLLSEQNIDGIVLYEGCHYPFFMAVGAEGEGMRKDYKTNWLVNAFVYNYFKNKSNISWVEKDSLFLMRFRNYYRHAKNIAMMYFSRGLKGLLERRTLNNNLLSNKEYISVISLEFQKRDLDNKLNRDNCRHVYYSYNRDLVDNIIVFPIYELSIRDLYHTFKYVKQLQRPTEMYLLGIHVPALKRELSFLIQKYAIYERRLGKTLSYSNHTKDTIMITNTTVGMDMIVNRNVARFFGWRHVNLQYVSMGRVLYPNLDMADEYYLYSRRTYELYKIYCSNYRLYLPMSHRNKEVCANQKETTIIFTIFTEPGFCKQAFVDYLRLLLPEIKKKKLNVNVIVKPHYRQDNMDQLRDVTKDYGFVHLVEPQASSSDILQRTTIAMSTFSSVIFEAMMTGVPSIIYNPEDKYHSEVYDNDFCYPDVNFVIDNPLQTLTILEKINEYKNDFEMRLQSFIDKSSAETDICKILKHRN